ncbi:site-specific DNA-methyltransferase, partial [candidate division KSB1 bacterium]|nr:site-specific DNA-methyltransferase [candidate division KSB1 bacterium]
LDENANQLGRVLCDSIFGSQNLNREIIWDIQVLSGFKVKGADQNWVLGHQSILFYSNNSKHFFEKLMQPQSLKYLKSFNRTDDDGRLYQVAHGRNIYRDEVEDKGKPFGDVWEDIRDIIDVERPFPDVWDDITSIVNIDQPLKDVWGDIMSFQQQPTSSERVRFETQKPEALLERIIKSSSENNKIVLDYFAGSGTTPSVCIKTGRKFIAVEMGDYFETILLPRLKRTVIGQKGTVSENNNYTGGGFFKYYELEQFEDALRLAKYNPKDDDLANVNFQKDEKLLDAVEIDRENEKVKIHFETLYPDVDIAETLSNILGKKIKKLNNERVIFEDDMEIIFDEMTYEKYPWIKPLIWWKSK